MRSSFIASSGSLALSLACAPTTMATSTPSRDPRLQDIELRIAASEKRLEQVQAEVSASEIRAKQARQAAEIEQCKAKNAQIQAKASAYQAECMGQVAAYNACEAKRSESKATGTLLGCFFGIGLAALSAGAATPLALGGCAAGRVIGGSGGECPKPSCTADFDKAESRALHQLRLTEFPMCGGYAGLAIKNEYVTKRAGIAIASVTSSSTAESLGLAAGDVLLGLQGRSISSAQDVQTVLARARVGSKIRAKVVRRHALLHVQGKVYDVDEGGRRSRGRAQLGAKLSRTVAKVRYPDAVKIVRVEGPAETAGLSPGMIIKGVNGQLIHNRDQLRKVLITVPSGSSVRFQATKGGRMERFDVVLEERQGRTGI